jgi:hypothetical protein
MFGKKKRYEKNEVESIIGIALNIKDRKGQKYSDEDIDKPKKSGLSINKIKQNADKFRTEQQKEKKNNIKETKHTYYEHE